MLFKRGRLRKDVFAMKTVQARTLEQGVMGYLLKVTRFMKFRQVEGKNVGMPQPLLTAPCLDYGWWEVGMVKLQVTFLP